MRFVVLLGGLLIGLSACGGSSNCTVPSNVGITPPQPAIMLYPKPGAVNVPDGNFTMVTYAATSVRLMGGGASITLPPPGPAPSPLPSPMATPYFPGAGLQGEAVPSLAAGTTYTVTDQRGGACNGPSNLGSFTTR